MQAVISVGFTRDQMMEDIRAIVRHELTNSPTTAAAHPSIADELLSIREAATLLGVTVQTIHEWKRRGLLAYHKLGSRSYIKRANVVSALQGIQRTAKSGKATPAKPLTAA